MPSTVVLVHGAWHGAWCFDRVVPLLEAAEIPTVVVELPGHGDDPGPFTDLHGDAAAVRARLDAIDGDVVLLGHSYGGAVITEAGVHPSVRHLVYLAAFALDADESAAAAATEQSEGISFEGRPNLADGIEFHDDGQTDVAPPSAAECFYNDCEPDTVEWALVRLGQHPALNLSQSPAAVAWREKPSTYVLCEQDMGVHPDLQAIMAARCTNTVRWPTSHSPFLSRPDLMADLLTDLARD